MGAAATRLSDKKKAALGDGPDVDRLGERDVGEARSSERRDRRAAEGRERPAPETTGERGGSEAVPTNETRTELAKHIPPPGDTFVEWFDSLSLSELDRLLADRSVKGGPRGARDVIGDCIRHPGDQHEWLMVAEARQFKKWGVSMRTIQESRTLTVAAIGKSFRHGATGSGAMHRALRAMIHSSGSYDEFIAKLNSGPIASSCRATACDGRRIRPSAATAYRTPTKCGAADDVTDADPLDGVAFQALEQHARRVRPEQPGGGQRVHDARQDAMAGEVGRPWQERVISGVTIVRSWDEALTIFAEDSRYNAHGVLDAPRVRIYPCTKLDG